MTPDERDALCIGLAKELVAVVLAEHAEVSESVILERIQDVWSQLMSAVAGDSAGDGNRGFEAALAEPCRAGGVGIHLARTLCTRER